MVTAQCMQSFLSLSDLSVSQELQHLFLKRAHHCPQLLQHTLKCLCLLVPFQQVLTQEQAIDFAVKTSGFDCLLK